MESIAAHSRLCAIGPGDPVRCFATSSLLEACAINAGDGRVRLAAHASSSRKQAVRVLAWFDVQTPHGSYPELNHFMGRFDLAPGGTFEYRPFSRDDRRTLRAVYLGPERPLIDDADLFLGAFADFAERGLNHLSGECDAAAERATPNVRAGWSERMTRLNWHAHGWMTLGELLLLDWAARRSARNGRHVVEIGSYQGRSTATIAAALGDAGVDSLLVSIDPNELCPQQADVTLANVSAVGERRRLVQVHRRSDEVDGLLRDGTACMAFIDGSHEAPDVLADFRRCDRWLAPGGLLALHDVYPIRHLGYEPPHVGPAQIVEQVLLPGGRYLPLAAAHLTLVLKKLS